MLHVWIGHGAPMNESCRVFEWVMSHIWMSHVAYMEKAMSHMWMRHVAHMNQSCRTYKRVMYTSHVAHMKESCRTYECILSYIWINLRGYLRAWAPFRWLRVCEWVTSGDWGYVVRWLWNDSFHWKCYTLETHQIEKLRFLGISRYKFKLRCWLGARRRRCFSPAAAACRLGRSQVMEEKNSGVYSRVLSNHSMGEWVVSHVWMSHVACMNEVGCAYECVMSHIWMRHVAYMNELCRTYEWVMLHVWMSRVAHMNDSCCTYEWVMSHIWMGHVACMNESCRTYECVMLHTCKRHVAHMNASCCMCEWVLLHM